MTVVWYCFFCQKNFRSYSFSLLRCFFFLICIIRYSVSFLCVFFSSGLGCFICFVALIAFHSKKETWKIWSLFVDLQFPGLFFLLLFLLHLYSIHSFMTIFFFSQSVFLVNCISYEWFKEIKKNWQINKTNLLTIKFEKMWNKNDFQVNILNRRCYQKGTKFRKTKNK